MMFNLYNLNETWPLNLLEIYRFNPARSVKGPIPHILVFWIYKNLCIKYKVIMSLPVDQFNLFYIFSFIYLFVPYSEYDNTADW
jgi:hypothetical protein